MTEKTDERIAAMHEPIALPRENGELVFAAPWEARAFGIAVALSEQGTYPWQDFSCGLATETSTAESEGLERPYYERWLSTLERMALDNGLLTTEELEVRTQEYEAGLHDDHHHDHE